ncbi:MAG TPA: Rieske 2Fe-2S domain-containing protein, partial [Vineibacter sp.]|nr:Rieske 2Fe-2S domain-containing protein [Vineibacter sp.]
MRNARDSEDLTRVGPGTVMGDFMRQYWIPAAMSSELVADGDPMRLMLLGEKLIAFRDSAGKVGVMDHRCPHRCASLFLGRNEQGGIRCVYHGWKFDAEGRCVDMPSVPAHRDFKDHVRARAYKVAERNGLVWVYMGARETAPPLPMIEPSLLPPSDMTVQFVQRSCNWLQALEGDIDTSHFGFLHVGEKKVEDFDSDDMLRYTVLNRAPEYHVADAPWGTTYAAYRPAEEGGTYWRFANYMFPFWTQTPQGEFANHIGARAWVPMDDHTTMFVHLHWASVKPSIRITRNDGSVLLHVGRAH